MDILVVGARGFIGGHVAAALEAAGHHVVRGERPAMDFARDVDPATWRPRLDGIDVVVNAAGVIRESSGNRFEDVHARGPVALFMACAERGIRVAQVSALGAAADAPTAFLRTKHAADAALLALEVPSVVLQPSLVFGPGGASARLFLLLASHPWLPLPAGGAQPLQPVHVDDVARAIERIVATGAFTRERIAAVGPAPLTFRSYLETLREQLGLGPAPAVAIPAALVGVVARLDTGLLDRDAWTMLQRGSVADPAPFGRLLGRPARPVSAFVPPQDREALRRDASLDWLLPVVRASIAITWLAAAVVSAFVHPVTDSYAMLARAGLGGTAATIALYGASALDAAFGVATLALRRRRWLWLAQGATVLAYTAIITVAMPEQWLHPFGALVKNLPILAALAVLYHLERR